VGNEKFIGSWKLVSSEFRRSDGEVNYPLGRDAVGLLMYDATGHMSAQLMRSNRPKFASDDHLKATPAEIKSAFEGYIAYHGTYEVNEEEGTVIHHVEGSPVPNWVGAPLKRFFEFSGNRLTLSTPPIPMGGKQVVGLLVWERAE